MRLEERGLAAAVRAEQAQHLTAVQAEGDALADRLAGIAEGEILNSSRMRTPRPRRDAEQPDEERRPDDRGQHAERTSIGAGRRASVSTATR